MIGILIIIATLFAAPKTSHREQWQQLCDAVRQAAIAKTPQQTIDRHVNAMRTAFLSAFQSNAADAWDEAQPDPANPHKLVTIRGTLTGHEKKDGSGTIVLIKTDRDSFYPVRFPRDHYNDAQNTQYVSGVIVLRKLQVQNRDFEWYIEPAFWMRIEENLATTLPKTEAPPPPKETPRPRKNRPTIGTGVTIHDN